MLLKIKELRLLKNISQELLSTKTGLSKRMIIDYEKENTDIQVKKLQLIATALEVDFFDMFNIPSEYLNSKEINNIKEPDSISILKDYNEHLKKQIEDLKDDKILLKNLVKIKFEK